MNYERGNSGAIRSSISLWPYKTGRRRGIGMIVCDEKKVSIDCENDTQLVTEMGYIYYTYLSTLEEAGIPWGNAKKTLQEYMRLVEESFVEKKHADLLKKFGFMQDEENVENQED